MSKSSYLSFLMKKEELAIFLLPWQETKSKTKWLINWFLRRIEKVLRV